MTSPPLEHPALADLYLCERGQTSKRRMSAGTTRTPGATVVETKRSSEGRKCSWLLEGGVLLSSLVPAEETRWTESPLAPAKSAFFCFFLYNDTGSCQTKTTGRVEHRLELLLWPLSTETPLCCVK